MSIREYQTLTYIMYLENLERERKDEEEARKADEERKRAEEERKKESIEEAPPRNRAEMILRARRAQENVDIPENYIPVFPEQQQPTPNPLIGLPMDELVEFLEDEM